VGEGGAAKPGLTPVVHWGYFRRSAVVGSRKLRTEEPMDKDLLEYLDRHFSSVDKHFSLVGERLSTMDGRFLVIDQRLCIMEHRFQQQLSALRERFEAFEGLPGEVGFVVEVVTNLSEQLAKLGDEISQRLDRIESYNRYHYIDLDLRVRKLEATG
jgi:hypothetical protein